MTESPSVANVMAKAQEPRNISRVLHGISITVEYKKGDRKPSGELSVSDLDFGYEQYADYGFIENTISGEPGEGLDVFIGPDEESVKVFLCELNEPEESCVFMEHKVLMGFKDYDSAEKFIKYQYPSGMVGFIYELSLADLQEWIELQGPMAAKTSEDEDEEGEDEDLALIVGMDQTEREPVLEVYD